ncbi:hypothetical protein O3P69_000513 [Scylla paramamosain]|uniref:Uncharacterized protein n=1 Tax=Scylla paramamosain TaxID=85552 RepID=A0AAW0UY08_SCYPA
MLVSVVRGHNEEKDCVRPHHKEELHPHQLLHLRNTEVHAEALMPPLHPRNTTLSISAEPHSAKHSSTCTGCDLVAPS